MATVLNRNQRTPTPDIIRLRSFDEDTIDAIKVDDVARAVRAAVISEYGETYSTCDIATRAVCLVLTALGYTASRVCAAYLGAPHEWVALYIDGATWHIDCTADQFFGPEILIATQEYLPPNWELEGAAITPSEQISDEPVAQRVYALALKVVRA